MTKGAEQMQPSGHTTLLTGKLEAIRDSLSQSRQKRGTQRKSQRGRKREKELGREKCMLVSELLDRTLGGSLLIYIFSLEHLCTCSSFVHVNVMELV